MQTFVVFLGKFWQFSWDEMAKYDLPAMLEKVFVLSYNVNIFLSFQNDLI